MNIKCSVSSSLQYSQLTVSESETTKIVVGHEKQKADFHKYEQLLNHEIGISQVHFCYHL